MTHGGPPHALPGRMFAARVLGVLALLSGMLVMAQGALTLSAASAATTGYPGGKRLWVVSVGSLTSGVAGTNSDFVRVGKYTFTLEGGASVTESFYYYSQSKQVGKQPSGVLGCAGTSTCQEYVPAGFEDDGQKLTGTWSYDATSHVLAISWSGGATERWTVTDPASDVAAMTLSSASYLAAGHGHGFGYGSNQAWGTGVSVGALLSNYARLYPGYHCQADNGTTTICVNDQTSTGAPAGINLSDYSACNSSCVTAYAQRSDSPDFDRYYIANMPNDPRAVGREFYDVGQNEDLCPADGHSIISPHVEAAYEIVGDNGRFHGFVGVEASLYNAAGPDYLQIFHYTDIG